jgi:ElaB/YqjD/DUF883 family membrane-anchored ribosome-binding protein
MNSEIRLTSSRVGPTSAADAALQRKGEAMSESSIENDSLTSGVAEKTRHLKDVAAERIRGAVDGSRGVVRGHPLTSTLVAVGVGALCGYFLAYGLSKRRR